MSKVANEVCERTLNNIPQVLITFGKSFDKSKHIFCKLSKFEVTKFFLQQTVHKSVRNSLTFFSIYKQAKRFHDLRQMTCRKFR